jgi:phenylpropionate dioxygenase-like ring-hydroxylating dioxygenase large terminal subunit
MNDWWPKRKPYDFRAGIRSYPRVAPGSYAEKAPYVDYGTEIIDPRRYRDPQESVREWEKMWSKVWTMAGVASDIPNAGDWFKYDLGKESFIVVRQDDGEIKAFYNVCPHRGNQIVRADFGKVSKCFSCAFHGWRYDKDGSLVEIKESETFRPEVIADKPGLTPVRCDQWGNFVFITMDWNAEPLLEFLGVVPEHLAAYKLENFRVFADVEYVFEGNWKTTIDGFLEFYHADQIHPELADVMETYWCQYDLYPKGISRMILPLGYAPDKLKDRKTVNEAQLQMLKGWGGDPKEWEHLTGEQYKQAMIEVKRRLGRRVGWDHFDALEDDQMTDDWNYHIFPNVTFNLYPDGNYVQLFRPHPTDPHKCIWRAITMIPIPRTKDFNPVAIADLGQGTLGERGWDGSQRPAIQRATKPAELGFVLMQDAELVPGVHRGVMSSSFKGFRLSEQEIRIRHYLKEVDRYLSDR